MPVTVKICGLNTTDSLHAAIDAGAEMVGFVFFEKSPRHLTLDQARILGAQVGGRHRVLGAVGAQHRGGVGRQRQQRAQCAAGAPLPAFSTACTMALPTTAASANSPMAANCSGVEMPKPTATGSAVALRMRAILAATAPSSASRLPVTPASDT